MCRAELHLTVAERRVVESVRWSGMRLAREVNRAHILAALSPAATLIENWAGIMLRN